MSKIAIIVLFLVLFPTAMALPPLPTTFFGDVIINGESAPLGTVVSGWVDGIKFIEYHVGDFGNSAGQYTIDFPGDDLSTSDKREGARDGDIVSFKVNGVKAPQTGTWKEAAGFVRVDLLFTSTQTDIFTQSSTGSSLDSDALDNENLIIEEDEVQKDEFGNKIQVIQTSKPNEDIIEEVQTKIKDAPPDSKGFWSKLNWKLYLSFLVIIIIITIFYKKYKK